MLWVGLSGGIGSGKSTVSARLARLGAVVVDSDRLAREVVEPGMPALAAIVERFGPAVVGSDGALDRAALGAVVFADEQARLHLEAITHPRIAARTRQLAAAAPQDAVVVHDIPLLVELDRAADYALTVIVDVPQEERLRRLVDLRGVGEAEARRRIAAQATDEQRRAAADVLLDNAGTVEELHDRVDRLWAGRLVPFEANLRAGTGSRRPETVELVGPDPAWRPAAVRLLARLGGALESAAVRLDHVGSTSVPGLRAKDVIDLQVVVEHLAVLDDPGVRDRLRTRGLVVEEGHGRWDHAHGTGTTGGQTWPKRMVSSADPARVVHCHVRPASSPAWRLALLLRDWLTAEEGERDAYAGLKEGFARSGLQASDYATAKEPWFAAAVPRAEAWAARTGWDVGDA
ncbi:dephospho-CoA kinase [Ornithinimicrobium cerasi]|uniref:Dephospho-CoA kinase n=1 Tax=Ornithinimicrobium cerasi TaxID=2248773 RepID=A0A285VD96_9MICO|nr:dephospho-CoA kinase [Ornithinimicrobium cerasi]SOC52054.1 dephospho-CoA kinase [Ornithinimicrobium cerasi]